MNTRTRTAKKEASKNKKILYYAYIGKKRSERKERIIKRKY